jgi:HEPN domain-containing protein
VIANFERQYVIWQNRATRFYIPARVLHHAGYNSAATFSAVQALELLLKATLVYWVRGFNPSDVRHRLAAMCRIIRQRVPGAAAFEIPRYFYHEQRYYSVSRYPAKGKGLVSPASFLTDLDEAFVVLVKFVPFQFNTELRRAVRGRPRRALLDLRRRNRQMRSLRRHLAHG